MVEEQILKPDALIELDSIEASIGAAKAKLAAYRVKPDQVGTLKDLRAQLKLDLGQVLDPQISADLPPMISWTERLKNPTPMQPELIEGILRKTGQMSLSGASKSGKSFMAIDLALSLCHGRDWLIYGCLPSRVLYVNFEIHDGSIEHRFHKVIETRKFPSDTENLCIWTLRGYSAPFNILLPRISEAIGSDRYDVLVFDPLYKLLIGDLDENSNSDMASVFSEFDRITRTTGASIIYIDHFSKGTKNHTAQIDRSSGAGTKGRFPDSAVTMTELEEPAAYRLEMSNREFASDCPLSLRWSYPVHTLAPDLASAPLKSNAGRTKETFPEDLEAVWMDLSKTYPDGVPIEDIRQRLGHGSESTFRGIIKSLNAAGKNRWHLISSKGKICGQKNSQESL